MIAIDGEAGALADQDAVGFFRGNELLRHRDGLVEHVMENLQARIEDQEETDAGFVEDGAEIFLVGPERNCGRLHGGEIVQLKKDALADEADAIEEALEALDLHPAGL